MSLDIHAHFLPVEVGEPGHVWLVLAALGAGVAAAAGAGALLGNVAVRRRPGWARSLSFGALVFLLFDLLKESAGLGQSLVRAPMLMLALVVAFGLGLVGLASLERRDGAPTRLAWLWTLGIGLHSMGEGWIVGTEAGRVALALEPGLASFLLHKGIEAATIAAVAGAALGRRTWAHALAIAAACLAGGVLGLLADDGRPALLLFAAGAGAATLALLRLGDAARGRAGAAGVFLGLLATYAAGVLHEL